MLRRTWFLLGLLLLVCMVTVGSGRIGLAQAVNHSSTDSGFSIGARERGDLGGKKPQVNSPDEPVGFSLDDGFSETLLGFGNSSSNRSAAAIWLNRFTVPNTIPYPLTLTGMYIMFPDSFGGNFIGDQVQLLIYVDADSDGNPANASLVFHEIRTITTANWLDFQLFPLSGTISTHGDLYVGWEDKWAEGGPQPREYIAAIDTTQSQHRSWVFGNEQCCTPNVANLGLNDYQEVIDDLGYGGNFMVRLAVDSNTPPTSTPTPTNTATPVPPRCPGETFTDVCPGDYFYEPVLALNQAGIVAGYTSSPPCLTPAHVPCFLPANNVTRGQTSKIISLAAGFNDPVSGQSFEDVPVGSTFYTYIERLAGRSIINGYACGAPGEPCVGPGNRPYFRPNANLSRGQLAKIASESFGYQDATNTQTFEDVPIGSTFHTYIERLVMRGIINGYAGGGAGEPCVGPGNRPYFRPSNQVTRAQTAKIVYLAMTQPTPTPTNTPVPTNTTAPTSSSTPATLSPTETGTPEITNTPATGTPTSTGVVTVTVTGTPNCCTDVTGTMMASCLPNPYTVNYSTTNNCTIQKTANIASMFEVSPNSNGPWQTLYVGDCWDCIIPTGTTQHTMTAYSGPLPAGNNYWRYRMEFSGSDCTWHLSLTSDPQPACVAPTTTPSPTPSPTGTSVARR